MSKKIMALILAAAFIVCFGTYSPAEVGIVIEIDSVTQLAADIDKVMMSLGLPPQGQNITGAIGSILSSPGMIGVDPSKSILMYVPFPDAADAEAMAEFTANAPVVMILTLSDDGQTYIDSVKKLFSSSQQAEDIHQFSGAMAPGMFSSGDMFVTTTRGKAIIGANKDSVMNIAAEVKKGNLQKNLLKGVSGRLKIGVNVQACLPLIESAINEMTMSMAMLSQQQPGGMPAPVNPAEMIGMETKMAMGMLKQISTMTMGIGVENECIEIKSKVTPLQDTTFATVLKDFGTPSDKYLSALPKDCPFAMVGTGLQSMDYIIEPYGEFIDAMMAGAPAEMSNSLTTVKQNMLKMKGMYGGDYAIGIVSAGEGNGIGLVEIISVTDAAKMKQMMEENFASSNEMLGEITPGVKLESKEKRAHKGVEITPYLYSIDLNAIMANQAGAAGGATTPPAIPTLPSWMSGIEFEVAFKDNDMFLSMGTQTVMNAAIDALSASAGTKISDHQVFKGLFSQASSMANRYTSLSLIQLVKTVLSAIPGADAQMLATLPSTGKGIAGYSVIHENSMYDVTRISLQELTTLKDSAPIIAAVAQQLIMGAMVGAPGAAVNDTSNAKAQCENNLLMIDSAKEQYALEKGLEDGAKVNIEDLKGYFSDGVIPKCPSGGTYNIKPIGEWPTCSIPEHSLE